MSTVDLDLTRRALRAVVTDFGRLVATDPDRVRALVSDALGADATSHRDAVTVLALAAEHGVAAALADGRDVSPATASMAATGVDPAWTAFAVDVWGAALAGDTRPTVRSHAEVRVEAAPTELPGTELPGTGLARTDLPGGHRHVVASGPTLVVVPPPAGGPRGRRGRAALAVGLSVVTLALGATAFATVWLARDNAPSGRTTASVTTAVPSTAAATGAVATATTTTVVVEEPPATTTTVTVAPAPPPPPPLATPETVDLLGAGNSVGVFRGTLALTDQQNVHDPRPSVRTSLQLNRSADGGYVVSSYAFENVGLSRDGGGLMAAGDVTDAGAYTCTIDGTDVVTETTFELHLAVLDIVQEPTARVTRFQVMWTIDAAQDPCGPASTMTYEGVLVLDGI